MRFFLVPGRCSIWLCTSGPTASDRPTRPSFKKRPILGSQSDPGIRTAISDHSHYNPNPCRSRGHSISALPFLVVQSQRTAYRPRKSWRQSTHLALDRPRLLSPFRHPWLRLRTSCSRFSHPSIPSSRQTARALGPNRPGSHRLHASTRSRPGELAVTTSRDFRLVPRRHMVRVGR